MVPLVDLGWSCTGGACSPTGGLRPCCPPPQNTYSGRVSPIRLRKAQNFRWPTGQAWVSRWYGQLPVLLFHDHARSIYVPLTFGPAPPGVVACDTGWWCVMIYGSKHPKISPGLPARPSPIGSTLWNKTQIIMDHTGWVHARAHDP
jgi:hypothetical protein